MPKRAASSRPSTPKKHKADPVLQLCTKVAKAVNEAQDIPDSAKLMLLDMLEPALAAPKEQRHRYQDDVASMVEQLLGSAEKRLQGAVAAAEGVVAADAGNRAKHEEAVHDADARLKEKQTDVKKKKYSLADDAMAFRSAKEALQKAQAEVEKFEQDLLEISTKKAALESSMAEHAEPLISGTASPAEAVGMVNHVTATLKKLGLDESMITALPNALAKEPSGRGVFDTLVIQQLREQVGKHLAALDKELKDAELGRAQRQAAQTEAEAALKAATEKQQASAETFVAARDEAEKLGETLSERQQEQRQQLAESKRHTRELAKNRHHLESFQTGPLAAFAELRDRTTAVPEEEPKPDAQMEESKPAEAAA